MRCKRHFPREACTHDFRINFYDGEKQISPWHDIPLKTPTGGYNMVTEITKFTKAKFEIDTKAELNPIVQDTKKGKLRYYHGPIFWNYGCLPQTWEDPTTRGGQEVCGSCGDNDPLDVVEIGSQASAAGSVNAVKALGVLSMIDDGELDWKLIAIRCDDPLAAQLNDIADVERLLPGYVSGIREWLRWYKTPGGKPLNRFGHSEAALSRQEAEAVIEETHEHYLKLVAGEKVAGKLWVPAGQQKDLKTIEQTTKKQKTAAIVG